MRQIIYFWNRLYYGIFDYHKRTLIFVYRMFAYIPLFLRHKQKAAGRDKRIVRNNGSINALSDDSSINVLSDTGCSTAIMISDITIMAFTALLIWTAINLMSILLPCISLAGIEKMLFFIITAIPTLAVNYLFLWRKDRYLEYFEAFQKAPERLNRRWIFISIICLLSSLTLFILSLKIM